MNNWMNWSSVFFFWYFLLLFHILFVDVFVGLTFSLWHSWKSPPFFPAVFLELFWLLLKYYIAVGPSISWANYREVWLSLLLLERLKLLLKRLSLYVIKKSEFKPLQWLHKVLYYSYIIITSKLVSCRYFDSPIS